jgi:hypothetical protein
MRPAVEAWIVSFGALCAVQHVVAAETRILDNHLVFLDAKGDVAALFLVDLVESWDEIPSR